MRLKSNKLHPAEMMVIAYLALAFLGTVASWGLRPARRDSVLLDRPDQLAQMRRDATLLKISELSHEGVHVDYPVQSRPFWVRLHAPAADRLVSQVGHVSVRARPHRKR